MSITHDHLAEEESRFEVGGDGIVSGPLRYTFDAAAEHLGLSPAELLWRLEGGEALAEIVAEEGRTPDGLAAALVDEARRRLDRHVAAGALSPDQRDRVLADLEHRLVELIEDGVPPG